MGDYDEISYAGSSVLVRQRKAVIWFRAIHGITMTFRQQASYIDLVCNFWHSKKPYQLGICWRVFVWGTGGFKAHGTSNSLNMLYSRYLVLPRANRCSVTFVIRHVNSGGRLVFLRSGTPIFGRSSHNWIWEVPHKLSDWFVITLHPKVPPTPCLRNLNMFITSPFYKESSFNLRDAGSHVTDRSPVVGMLFCIGLLTVGLRLCTFCSLHFRTLRDHCRATVRNIRNHACHGQFKSTRSAKDK